MRLVSVCSCSVSCSVWLRLLSCSARVLRPDLSARCRDMPLAGGYADDVSEPSAWSGAAAEAVSEPGATSAEAAASLERLSPTRLPPVENMCRKASGALWMEPM